MTRRAADLMAILIHGSASLAERDDAAMDLGDYPEQQVLALLVSVAADPSTPDILYEVCGESIARIWVAVGQLDMRQFRQLHHIAQEEALAEIRQHKPEWLERYNLQ